jgi:hypothetical protein
MQVLPSTQSLRVLLAWSEAVESRGGWVKLDAIQIPALAGMSVDEIQACLSELNHFGYCTPAAHGDLVYLTREGSGLARAARTLVERGAELRDLTLEALGPSLRRLPFFQLPSPLRLHMGAGRSVRSL